MKASLFCTTRYDGPTPASEWPVPGSYCDPRYAVESMRTTLARFKLGDEVGFDWVTVAEHHFAPFSMTPNPCVMAAALVNVVKRAKIAILGPIIPIVDPIRVAEEIAMIDVLTGGRTIVGLMRGSPNEYVTYNSNPSESRGRFEEALGLICKAWSELEPFGWLGKFYEYRTVSIWPRPVQRPYPPIYISASSPESGEFAARNRLGAAFAFTTLSIAGPAAKHFMSQCRTYGWEPDSSDIIYRLAMHVADTDAEAIDDIINGAKKLSDSYSDSKTQVSPNSLHNVAIEQAVAEAGYFGRDRETQQARLRSRGDLDRILSRREAADRIQKGQLLAGSPDTVIEQIRRIRDEIGAGILDLVILPHLGEKAFKAIELFGTKVLPQIREL